MKLFLKILFFIFTMVITVGEANSSTVVTISQAATASSLFQEKQFTHCKNEFGLLDRQLSSSQVAHLKSLHSDKAIESCVQFWINPSFKNSMAFVLEGVVCQWKTPELVVAGLSAGLLGWQAMGTRSIDGAAHVVARDGMRSAAKTGTNAFTYTKSAGKHLTEVVKHGENAEQLARPYMKSPLTIQEIMSTGKGIPDATFKGGFNWNVPGTFRGSQGIWQLGLNPETNVIYHFNFVY